MGGTIEGKFKLLHTVKDHKKLGSVARRLGIMKEMPTVIQGGLH